jgi:phage terminase small subunit
VPRKRKVAGLTPAQRTFVLVYIANGFNATGAYLSAHPNVTGNTARTEGARTLANPDVKRAIDRHIEKRWKALHMTGDEVLGRLALDARADIRLAFDAKGKMLPVSEWPDDLVNSVNTVQIGDKGARIQLTSKIAARRILAEVTKKLKPTGAGQLARILAGDFEDEDDE